MSMQNKLIIVGEGEWLDIAHDAATRLGRWAQIDLLVLERTGPYSFDIELKLGEVINGAEYFLALDGDHFGTIRESILSHMMQKGCSIASLVPDQCAKLFKMNANCMIHPTAIVSLQNSGWGYNVFIGPNAYVGAGVSIARTVTISSNSEIHTKAAIGKNVSLNSKVIVASSVGVKSFSSVDCHHEPETRLTPKSISYYKSDLFPRQVSFSDNNA
jgi:acetyltransferase-like isoleucine patch superfamily enzyme